MGCWATATETILTRGVFTDLSQVDAKSVNKNTFIQCHISQRIRGAKSYNNWLQTAANTKWSFTSHALLAFKRTGLIV